MIKKFLVAAIVGFLMLSSQIAAAEDYDWNQAPRIGTKAELARYVENERRKGNTKIRVILINGLKVKDDFGYLIPCFNVQGSWYPNSDGTMRIDYEITEYPGTRVANAYMRGDTNGLTNEELQLYYIAVAIVDEAQKYSTPADKARYLHDEICKRTTSETGKETALDALVYGKANCEGYTDAFYMLGRMAGLNVGRIGGFINSGGKHMWNTITFRDGKTYCVDVTNDYLNNSNDFFCATKEFMQQYFSCHWEIIPNLQ